MKNWRTALLVLLPLAGGALAAGDDWYKKFSGTYWIYSGSLGDSGPPTAKDKKIGFTLDGQAAREIFDAIGPDVHDPCTEGSGSEFVTRTRKTCLAAGPAKGNTNVISGSIFGQAKASAALSADRPQIGCAIQVYW